jgi:hypothetical protein
MNKEGFYASSGYIMVGINFYDSRGNRNWDPVNKWTGTKYWTPPRLRRRMG